MEETTKTEVRLYEPICILVKNTSEEAQDAYLFDVSGKLNSKDIRIDSANYGIDYNGILEDLLKHTWKIKTVMFVGGASNIDDCFPDDHKYIEYVTADASGKKEHNVVQITLDPYQYQTDRATHQPDYILNSFGHLKIKLNGWTKILIRLYPIEKITNN